MLMCIYCTVFFMPDHHEQRCFHGGRSSPTVVAQTIKLDRVVGQTDHADGNSLLPWGHRVFQGLESRLPFDACKISSVSHVLLRFSSAILAVYFWEKKGE